MKLVIDRNMPYAREAFSTLGEVFARDGRDLTSADVRDADALFTRSTTRVNAKLLEGSAVRYYGSAVIGTDHIDIPYLEARHIPWVAAPGCNAESVANYVTSALLWLGAQHGFSLKGKTIGIIGCGNVGSKVLRHAKALGLNILVSDPPKEREEIAGRREKGEGRPPSPIGLRRPGKEKIPYVPLEQLLSESDIVTCHVPLTKSGPDATFQMLDTPQFAQMKPGVIFINAARGAILSTDALLSVLGTRVAHAVIDCWEGEPTYRTDLLARADIATPHIAGHSYEGKVNGTKIIYTAYLAWLAQAAVDPACREQAAELLREEAIEKLFALPPPPVPHIDLSQIKDTEELLRQAVLRVYDIEADSLRLKRSCVEDPVARAAAFDQQRSKYPMRREFTSTTVTLKKPTAKLLATLQGLGFKV